jgi:hypothetical protein
MKHFLKRFFFIMFICLLNGSCAKNVLTNLGSKSSDEALMNDAQVAVNNQNYDLAIDLIANQMSAEGQQKTSAKELLAAAYAGKCGLNFLSFVDSISKAASGVSAYKLVSTPFVTVVVDPPSCLNALNTMQSIAPVGSRTTSENAFTAITGMSLMGTATRAYTDKVPTNGDGAEDSNNIACTLTDAQMDNVILGFGFMVENFSYLSSSQLGSSSTALTDIITMCATLGGAACNITKASDITAGLRTAMRKLMSTVEYGVGKVVVTGNPGALAGACP